MYGDKRSQVRTSRQNSCVRLGKAHAEAMLTALEEAGVNRGLNVEGIW